LAQIAVLRRQLTTSLRTRVSSARMHVQRLSSRPVLAKPLSRLRLLSRRLDELDESATRSLRRRQSRLREKLASLSARLETLSPLATLTRGYSVTTREDGSIVRDVQNIVENDILTTRVARGIITSRVATLTADDGHELQQKRNH
ncbi:MAG: hypothetical protein IAF94_06025, partial [Pirellulaceae bacterium]|nr:hypothetical protein [Pirellulaceae bacterium]